MGCVLYLIQGSNEQLQKRLSALPLPVLWYAVQREERNLIHRYEAQFPGCGLHSPPQVQAQVLRWARASLATSSPRTPLSLLCVNIPRFFPRALTHEPIIKNWAEPFI